MRILSLIKTLWKSPVHRILLLIMAVAFVWCLSVGIIKDDTYALFSCFLLVVFFGELLWFTNIVNHLEGKIDLLRTEKHE